MNSKHIIKKYFTICFIILKNQIKYFVIYRLNLLNEVIQKSKYSISCDKDTQIYWKNLPKSARKLWSFLAINQSFPSPLNEWTVKQIAQFVVFNFNFNFIVIFFC